MKDEQQTNANMKSSPGRRVLKVGRTSTALCINEDERKKEKSSGEEDKGLLRSIQGDGVDESRTTTTTPVLANKRSNEADKPTKPEMLEGNSALLIDDSGGVTTTAAKAVHDPSSPQEDNESVRDSEAKPAACSDAASVVSDAAVAPLPLKAEHQQHLVKRSAGKKESSPGHTTAPDQPKYSDNRNAHQLLHLRGTDPQRYATMSDEERRLYNAKLRQKYHRQKESLRLRYSRENRERQERKRQSYVALTPEAAKERNARREKLELERYQRLSPARLEARRRRRANTTTWMRTPSASQVSSVVSDDDSDSQPDKKQKKVAAKCIEAQAGCPPRDIMVTVPMDQAPNDHSSITQCP